MGALILFLAIQVLPPSSPDYFEAKVRPILAENCYGCHTGSALGGLRLDSLEAMTKGGKRGPAIKPGDPNASLLIRAVRHIDADLQMPMDGGKLKDSEIEILAEWVKAGAVWPKTNVPVAKNTIPSERKNFWSFVPLHDVEVPQVNDGSWAHTAIDKFVLSRLEREGIKPAPRATKRDLIRRATLDLIGLPPTFEEIQAFEKDDSPDAFAKVVDRLLASPQYGERWGRLWLDVARYGEDDYRSLDPMRRGFNPYPNAYLYRDWVIQAFNNDMPYAEFIKQQIAGDLMDERLHHKTLPATGFLGLGPWYYDNGAVEVTRADERHDRVDVVTRGFLGLTVACARCHDHKYDPIPTTDYYSLAGVFLNTAYHEYPRVPKAVVDRYKTLEDEVERKQKLLREIQGNLSSQLSQSLAFETAKYLEALWEVSGTPKKEKSIVVEEKKLDYELLDRWIKYMEKSTDLYPFKKPWQELTKKTDVTALQVRRAAREFQQKLIEVMLAKNELKEENDIIFAKALPGTTPKKRSNKPNEFITNDDFCPGCALQLKALPTEETAFYTEIFIRELDGADPAVQPGVRLKPGVLAFNGWGLEKRVGSESQAMMAAIRKEIDETKKKIEPYYSFVHGVKDLESPSNLRVSLRGDPFNLGDEAPRHFLSVLSDGDPKPFANGSGRMELAEAIVQQPIAMRVIVNRIWKWHFGTGIVDSPSNFGMTGERPTNPELLEYLANTFVHSGLSIKKAHREIMLSSVYQLSTKMDDAAYAKDSGNRLYWRANPKRLDAEQIRDSILSVAGDLDKALGGPSEPLTPTYKRRSVYGKVGRFKLDDYLQLFDFPSPNISAEKRFTTTVPLQRLFMMNSDFVQLEAEQLVKRVAAEPDQRSQIRKMYEIIYGRDPAEREFVAAAEFLKNEPLIQYQERKTKSSTAETKTEDEEKDDGEKQADPAGMMSGVPGFGADGRSGEEKTTQTPKYEATALGRYAKVLLSSSEFMFIN